jgi:hypothetical protein
VLLDRRVSVDRSCAQRFDNRSLVSGHARKHLRTARTLEIVIVNRYEFQATSPNFHQRFVPGNSNDPGTETGIGAKPIDVVEHLQERL